MIKIIVTVKLQLIINPVVYCHLLIKKKATRFVLFFKFDPILKNHFEFFVEKVMSESVSSWFVFDEIILSGVTFFHGSVEVDTVPDIRM